MGLLASVCYLVYGVEMVITSRSTGDNEGFC